MTRPASDRGPLWLCQLRSEVLRRVRAQQAALAAHLGITPKHMSQVLTGTVNGNPELLTRIAEAVGVRIAIVIGESEPVPLPPSRRRGRPPKLRAGFPGGEHGDGIAVPARGGHALPSDYVELQSPN